MLYKNKIRRKSYTLISVVMITGFLLTSCRQTLIPATGLESNTAPDILLVQAETPVPEELLETTPTFVPTVLQDLLSEFSTFLPLVNRSAEPTPAPTIPPVIPTLPPPGDGDWAMVASNPQRTSWSREEVSGNLGVEWYRPIAVNCFWWLNLRGYCQWIVCIERVQWRNGLAI
jgi:hypothetical protein